LFHYYTIEESFCSADSTVLPYSCIKKIPVQEARRVIQGTIADIRYYYLGLVQVDYFLFKGAMKSTTQQHK